MGQGGEKKFEESWGDFFNKKILFSIIIKYINIIADSNFRLTY